MPITVKLSDSGGLNAQMQVLVEQQGGRLKAANQKNADEFAVLVRSAVPQDANSRHGRHLAGTIAETAFGPVGVQVSIGSEADPYPAHLEFGHRARNGAHVPGKSSWYPAKRVIQKRAHDRILRAQRAAIKAAAPSG
ncbi:MAG TPA: hypothetical protein VGG68_00690 [Caulobacteraceae bacterium]|jgi:hypothetical protein